MKSVLPPAQRFLLSFEMLHESLSLYLAGYSFGQMIDQNDAAWHFEKRQLRREKLTKIHWGSPCSLFQNHSRRDVLAQSPVWYRECGCFRNLRVAQQRVVDFQRRDLLSSSVD